MTAKRKSCLTVENATLSAMRFVPHLEVKRLNHCRDLDGGNVGISTPNHNIDYYPKKDPKDQIWSSMGLDIL